jgi:hypothetical protein
VIRNTADADPLVLHGVSKPSEVIAEDGLGPPVGLVPPTWTVRENAELLYVDESLLKLQLPTILSNTARAGYVAIGLTATKPVRAPIWQPVLSHLRTLYSDSASAEPCLPRRHDAQASSAQ